MQIYLKYMYLQTYLGPDNTRIGVVVFSNQVNLAIRLNQYENAEELSNAIANLGHMGGTTNTPGNNVLHHRNCLSWITKVNTIHIFDFKNNFLCFQMP